ncbi:unnamed protein product [Prorocentrum cordatum]|uniref:AP2/ERF domain-containing protein n=1 Tax=Prorocentrum cordatum TaxID=2364126 RepID=A0ABN9VJA3_9DINO|nr:unnamed protein product [Polarella glacialis]
MNFWTQSRCRITRLKTHGQKTIAQVTQVDGRSCYPSIEASFRPGSYNGVSMSRDRRRWIARITLDGRQSWLGTFSNPIDAALAYDAALRTANLDVPRWRYLNFPTPEEVNIMQADSTSEHRRRSNLKLYGNNFSIEAASKVAVEKTVGYHFEVRWLGEGTRADGIFRPQQHTADEWIGIQVKATAGRRGGAHQFTGTKEYAGLMLVCVALDCMQFWIIPGVCICARNLSISAGGKWDAYRRCVAGVADALHLAWGDCAKFARQPEAVWDMPVSERHQIEYLAYKLSKIVLEGVGIFVSRPFTQMGAVDFLLNGKVRVQAKARTRMSSTSVGNYNIILRRTAGNGIYPRFSSDEFDALIVQLIRGQRLVGIFVIPMFELLQRGLVAPGIPRRGEQSSLMLYPPWSLPNTDKARSAKAWQSKYFFQLDSGLEEGDAHRLQNLLVGAIPETANVL